jgi:hypothetical protein
VFPIFYWTMQREAAEFRSLCVGALASTVCWIFIFEWVNLLWGWERDRRRVGNKLRYTGCGTLKTERKENIYVKPTENATNKHGLNTQKRFVWPLLEIVTPRLLSPGQRQTGPLASSFTLLASWSLLPCRGNPYTRSSQGLIVLRNAASLAHDIIILLTLPDLAQRYKTLQSNIYSGFLKSLQLLMDERTMLYKCLI